jgi:hypothetical protein
MGFSLLSVGDGESGGDDIVVHPVWRLGMNFIGQVFFAFGSPAGEFENVDGISGLVGEGLSLRDSIAEAGVFCCKRPIVEGHGVSPMGRISI